MFLIFIIAPELFFSEIRSKYSVREEMGTIRNLDGDASTTTTETLKNWSEYYKNLYSSIYVEIKTEFPTPTVILY